MLKKILLINLLFSFIVISCDIDSGSPSNNGDSAGAADAVISDFENDTMTEEYANYWNSTSGDILILKDNTFVWFKPEDRSPSKAESTPRPPQNCTPYMMGYITGSPLQTSTLNMETSVFYTNDYDLESISSTMEVPDLLSAYSSLLSGGSTEVTTSDLSFESETWITQEEFEIQFESSYTGYYDQIFDSLEELYESMGMSISTIIPNWEDLKNQILAMISTEDFPMEDFFPTYECEYEITENDNGKNMIYHGFEEMDYSFIPTPTPILYP